MIGFTVAVGGILVRFIDIGVEYWYSNNKSIWYNLIFADSNESIDALIGYNSIVFLWGFQYFFCRIFTNTFVSKCKFCYCNIDCNCCKNSKYGLLNKC